MNDYLKIYMPNVQPWKHGKKERGKGPVAGTDHSKESRRKGALARVL